MYNDSITKKSRVRRVDAPLAVLTLLCCAVGALTAASQQYRGAAETFTEGDTSQLVFRYLVSLTAGAVLGAVLVIVGHRRLLKLSPIVLTIGLLVTALTFTPLGYAPEGSDDRAWLSIGGYGFQPSEFLKLCFIVSFAAHLHRLGKSLNKPSQLMLLLLHAGVPTALVWLQGDQGTALVFVFISLGMLIYAGLDSRILTAALFALPLIGFALWRFALAEHQRQRILSVLDPSRDPMGTGFQQLQARRAFASGGLLGEGLFSLEGDTVYVSQSQNDFVLSYLGRAGGLLLTAAVVILMFSLTLRIVQLSGRSGGFSGLVRSGTAALFFTHTLINVSMELGIMPVIGVPLPFISAGGTARTVMLALVMLACKEKTTRI